MVDEHVLSVVSSNESITLFPIEPLDCSLCHVQTSLALPPRHTEDASVVFLKREDIVDERMTLMVREPKVCFRGHNSSLIYSFSR